MTNERVMTQGTKCDCPDCGAAVIATTNSLLLEPNEDGLWHFLVAGIAGVALSESGLPLGAERFELHEHQPLEES